MAWLSAKAPRRKPGAPGLPADLIRPRSQPAQIGGPDPGALASIDIIGTSRDVMLRATALSTFAYGRPYLSTWDVTRAVTDGFERVIWVFRGIDAIASNAASLEIVWRSGHPEKGEVVTDHPALPVLNGQTNVFEKSEAFIYRAFCIYLLSKRGCFIEIIRDNVGRPIALYILPPHLTNPIPDPERYVSGFRVLVPGGGSPVDVPAWEDNGDPHVLWIRKPHPLDAYSSITPLESAGISIDTDYYARMFNRTFLMNDGRPGGILAVKGYLNELDSETLKRRFSGGQNAGKTAVVEADNISWLDLAANPRDAQYIEGLGVTRTDILLALGVPLSIIGDASASTFENSDAETRIFWVNTMSFHLSLFAGGLGALDPDPETYCAFDTSVIGVLQREREAQKTSDLALVKSYLMTPDEFRKRWGEVPFGTPASRALWVPSTMTPMPAKGDKIDDIVWGPPQPEPPPPPPPAVHVYQGGAVPAGPEAPPPPNGKQPPDVAAALAEAEAATNGKPPKAPAEPAASAKPPKTPAKPVPPKPKPKKDVEPGEVKVTLGNHGVMVAVYPSAETAAKLAVAGGEDPEDLHVTIAYLGKQDGFTADELAQLEATISAWAATEEPFVAEITGTGQFVADGDVPQIALVSSEHLAGLRHRLLARLEDEGLVLAG